jgi:hypothetical protein
MTYAMELVRLLSCGPWLEGISAKRTLWQRTSEHLNRL